MDSQSPTPSPSNDDPFARLARSLEGIDEAEAESSDSDAVVAHPSGVSPTLRFLGDYELVDFLGAGGMGKVYRAKHRSIPGKHAAVKVIHELFRFDAKRIARFQFEALAASRLSHPGIVSVITLAEQNGVQFIVQELVEGKRSLGQEIEARRKSPPDDHERWVAELFIKIAEALGALHGAKVIHRDIKPDNILLTPDGEPKVADFGLARDLDAPTLTASDASPGTIEYMSPEQINRKHGEIDARTDVYALGVTLYEALAFTRWVPEVTSLEKHRIILEEEMRDLRTVRAAIPLELSLICRKAAEKESHRRYQSMAEFAADLRRFLVGEPVLATAPSTLRRAQLWVRQHPIVSAAGSVGLTGLCVTLGLYSQLLRKNSEVVEQTGRAEAALGDFLSLSAQANATELSERLDRLWPPTPDRVSDYEAWLDEARVAVDGGVSGGSNASKRSPGLVDFKRRLEQLRVGALPVDALGSAAEAKSHPRFNELERKRAELLWFRRAAGSVAWPDLSEVEAEMAPLLAKLDARALYLEAHAELLGIAERPGREVHAFVLSKAAVERFTPELRPVVREVLAKSLAKLMRLEDARRETELARAEADDKEQLFWVAGVEAEVVRLESLDLKAEIAQTEREIELLEDEVSQRRSFQYRTSAEKWWDEQLSRLIHDLEALGDKAHGPRSIEIGAPYGWGVQRRLEFGRTIQERSITGTEAKGKWDQAIRAIQESPRYASLVIRPQIGLLPLGEDPSTGLWEFVHLQTGSPPVRNEAGKLMMTEDCGVVLVLLPGGSFRMGSQQEDPEKDNYSELATSLETPDHEVRLSAYFISKYELNQAQWLRVMGSNPSDYQPPSELAPTLLHPVEAINWFDAQKFMHRTGLRLPSEAQWENATRGGTHWPWWTGPARESLIGKVNIADRSAAAAGADWGALLDWPEIDDGSAIHAEVGSFPPNPFGLHEVTGNVMEWCLDGWGVYRSLCGTDPVFPNHVGDERVVRDGAFMHTANEARSAHRQAMATRFQDTSLGVRPARNLD